MEPIEVRKPKSFEDFILMRISLITPDGKGHGLDTSLLAADFEMFAEHPERFGAFAARYLQPAFSVLANQIKAAA